MKHETANSSDTELKSNLANLIDKLNENNLISLINISDFCGLNEKNKSYTRTFLDKLTSQSNRVENLTPMNEKNSNTTKKLAQRTNQGKVLKEITTAAQTKADKELSQIYDRAANGDLEYFFKKFQFIVDNSDGIKMKYRKHRLPSLIAKLILEKKVQM